MKRPNDGGPAFMAAELANVKHAGMSLRDYFAAHAMQALIAGNCASAQRGDISWTEAELWAPDVAYRVADAMLEARMA